MAFALRFVRLRSRSVLFPALAFLLVAEPALAQIPMRQFDTTLKQMLDALQTKEYDRFTAYGDDQFKAGFTRKKFEDLAGKLGPRLQKGYSTAFLTTLRQQNYVVYLWKLSIQDAGDEVLVTLAIKGGNVSGFLVR